MDKYTIIGLAISLITIIVSTLITSIISTRISHKYTNWMIGKEQKEQKELVLKSIGSNKTATFCKENIGKIEYPVLFKIRQSHYETFNMVINMWRRVMINGHNGSGKSTFIGTYIRDNPNKTIYIKAWEHDRIEDPLLLILNKIIGSGYIAQGEEELKEFINEYYSYIRGIDRFQFQGNTYIDELSFVFSKLKFKNNIEFIVDEVDRTRPEFYIEIMELFSIILNFEICKQFKIIYVADKTAFNKSLKNIFYIADGMEDRFNNKYFDRTFNLVRINFEAMFDYLFEESEFNWVGEIPIQFNNENKEDIDLRELDKSVDILKKYDPSISPFHYIIFAALVETLLKHPRDQSVSGYKYINTELFKKYSNRASSIVQGNMNLLSESSSIFDILFKDTPDQDEIVTNIKELTAKLECYNILGVDRMEIKSSMNSIQDALDTYFIKYGVDQDIDYLADEVIELLEKISTHHNYNGWREKNIYTHLDNRKKAIKEIWGIN